MTHDLDHARTALHTATRSPAGDQATWQHPPTDTARSPDDRQWITPPPHHRGTEITRPARTPCPDAHRAPLPQPHPYRPNPPTEPKKRSWPGASTGSPTHCTRQP